MFDKFRVIYFSLNKITAKKSLQRNHWKEITEKRFQFHSINTIHSLISIICQVWISQLLAWLVVCGFSLFWYRQDSLSHQHRQDRNKQRLEHWFCIPFSDIDWLKYGIDFSDKACWETRINWRLPPLRRKTRSAMGHPKVSISTLQTVALRF